jgi:murein DD-endopeptidase MepM/ murein hydrolase activator NlpD
MDNSDTISFPKSPFTDVIVRENGLNKHGFTAWVLYPGMESGAENTWWGGRGKRSRPHEGVDLRFYRGTDDNVFSVDAGAKIPVMYDGVVAKIIEDFLGETVIIEHKFPKTGEDIFLSLYGHTSPINELVTGQSVKAGEIIATMAPSRGAKAPMPHLHLSLAWSRKSISYNTLDWKTIGNPDIVSLIDPWPIIGASER